MANYSRPWAIAPILKTSVGTGAAQYKFIIPYTLYRMSTRRKHHELEQGAVAAAAGGLAAAALTWWRFTSYLKHLINTYEQSAPHSYETHDQFLLALKHLAYTEPRLVHPSVAEAGPDPGPFAGADEEEDIRAEAAPRADGGPRGWPVRGGRSRSEGDGGVEIGGPYGPVKVGKV